MNKIVKKVTAVALSLALLSPTSAAFADGAKGVSIERIGGADRYDTAIKVSEKLGADPEKVIIASGENFPDALAGSVLTEGKYPILLVKKEAADSATIALARKAKEVIVLGGESSISTDVAEALKGDRAELTRIAGKDRYETAKLIAAEVNSDARVIASGVSFPDAVAGAGYALLKNAPILLTAKGAVQATVDSIDAATVKSATILGGASTVDSAMDGALIAHGASVTRLAGADRYATSIEIAREFDNPKTLILATGGNYPDALAASSLSGKYRAPVLLVQGDQVSRDLNGYLQDVRGSVENIIIVGGEGSVSKAFADSVKDNLQATSRTISANRLEKMIADKAVKIFDLRNEELYEAGHLPGAMRINNKEFEDPDNAVDGEIATPAQFEALMSRFGITADDTIVVYSNATSPQMGPRLVWTLQVYGHNEAYVLDGQYQGWEKQGKAIEKGKGTEPTPSEFKITETDNTINVGKEAVINRAAGTVLLDCRPVDEYTGERVATGNARGGHIPGAVNMPYLSTVTEDGYFKDPGTLKEMYKSIGVTADKEIIVYCQRGHRASHTWFVLTHVLGFENVKIYDGSMMEWSNLPELPVVKGEKPE